MATIIDPSGNAANRIEYTVHHLVEVLAHFAEHGVPLNHSPIHTTTAHPGELQRPEPVPFTQSGLVITPRPGEMFIRKAELKHGGVIHAPGEQDVGEVIGLGAFTPADIRIGDLVLYKPFHTAEPPVLGGGIIQIRATAVAATVEVAPNAALQPGEVRHDERG